MAQVTAEAKARQLVVYIPDTRGVTVSRFGRGNLKIGLDGVYTYSRLPGHNDRDALGSTDQQHFRDSSTQNPLVGTCPGATKECQAICYAARPVSEDGAVYRMWRENSETEDVPTELPHDAKLIRIHVSGDFSSVGYIHGWWNLAAQYPWVKFWAYTRSWRVPDLLPALEDLRALPNVQLFASMDVSTPDLPPEGWRRAWIDGDPRAGEPVLMEAHGLTVLSQHNFVTVDGKRSYICPEETKRRTNCEECRYCIDGKRNDVTFLKH